MSNGIHYFLGNIPGHVTHALPLYEQLGGTFVVLSSDAQEQLATYGVPSVVVDDRPDEFLRLSRRIRPTIDYLDEHADVVVFYEMFLLPRRFRSARFDRIFLWHGNFLKPFLTMNRMRKRAVRHYDHIAALGPVNRRRMLESGRVREDQLVDLGIARTDEVVSTAGRVEDVEAVASLFGPDAHRPIVSYMPTYWGVSTIETIGKEIVRHWPDDLSLVVRPHPQTPATILEEYVELIDGRSNIVLATPNDGSTMSLLELFLASTLVIGDVSSVMLEAILLDKPLLFARDPAGADEADLAPIRELVDAAGHITDSNVADIGRLVEQAIATGIRSEVWERTKDSMFYDHDGTSTERIADFVRSRQARRARA